MTNVYSSKIAQIKAQLQAELAAKEAKNYTLENATAAEVAEFLDIMQEVDQKQQADREIAAAKAIQARRYA